MPNLFQSFVAKWLKNHLREYAPNYAVKEQYTTWLDAHEMFYYRIDLVLQDSTTDVVLGVLDTKYKRKTDPESTDIKEIVAYAAKMQTRKAFLVYPSLATRDFDLQGSPTINVKSLVFDIGQDPEIAWQAFAKKLLANIR